MSEDGSNGVNPDTIRRKCSFSEKLLMFISGITFVILILFLFTEGFSLVTLGILAGIFALIWGCLVFIWNIPLRFNCRTSHLCNKLSLISAIIVDVVIVLLSGFSLSACSVARSSDIADILSKLPIADTISSVVNTHLLLFIWIGVIVLGILSFFVLGVVFHVFIGIRLRDAYIRDGKKSIILFALASVLWLFIPLLSLYSANLAKVSIEFIGILSLIYIIGTLLLYFIVLAVSLSAFTAFCACAFCWIGLTVSDGIIAFGISITKLDAVVVSCIYLLIMFILVFLLCYGIKKAVSKFEIKTNKIGKWVLGLVLILIIITLVPITITVADLPQSSSAIHSELSFTVDSNLSHPNIYWIHAESMMDPTVLEKYLGNETVGFSDILTEKGFYVNHDAWLFSFPRTSSAVPALLLPDYYDKMRDRYYNADSYVTYPGENVVIENINAEREANEFISSFEAAGYNSVSLGCGINNRDLVIPAETVYYFDPYLTVASTSSGTVFDKLCYYDLTNELDFLSCNIRPLSSLFSDSLHSKIQVLADNIIYSFEPLEIAENFSKTKEYVSGDDWLEEYGAMIQALQLTLSNESNPMVMFIDPGALAHFWFEYDENGTAIPYSEDLHDYYGQYILSEKILLYIVDTILENDPDAVIVVQADHGLHSYTGESGKGAYIEAFGPETDMREIVNHVMSAVYIPDVYKTNEYSEDILSVPQNIVRYLINSYVGDNYEYTVPDDFITKNYTMKKTLSADGSS